MTPRGGRRKTTRSFRADTLAVQVAEQVRATVKPLERYAIGISISMITDDEGRPCGQVIATKTPRRVTVTDAIPVEKVKDEPEKEDGDPEAP